MKAKAISLQNPWAWLVCAGLKKVEFRSRRSNFRGECYIQCAKKFDLRGYLWICGRPNLPGRDIVYNKGRNPKYNDAPGRIIGKVTVKECLPVDEAREKYPEDPWLKEAGDDLGKYAYIISESHLFRVIEFIPCRGKVFPLFFDVEIG